MRFGEKKLRSLRRTNHWATFDLDLVALQLRVKAGAAAILSPPLAFGPAAGAKRRAPASTNHRDR
jgi:hypothetical protein